MVDQVKQEDEYHFQDLGQTDENEDPKGKPFGLEAFNMLDVKKKVFIAAGGAIILVILYNAIAGLFGGKKSVSSNIKTPKQLSSKEMGVSTGQTKINTRVKPRIIPPRDISPPSNIMSAQTQQEFNGLTRALQSIELAIKDLDSRIIDLQVNQSNLQKQLTPKVPKIKSSLGGNVKKTNRKKIFKETYEVIGVIHGRAWLKNPKGNTFTIKLGDRLPGYGKVKLIEPEQGVVVTSSGDVIKFNNE